MYTEGCSHEEIPKMKSIPSISLATIVMKPEKKPLYKIRQQKKNSFFETRFQTKTKFIKENESKFINDHEYEELKPWETND